MYANELSRLETTDISICNDMMQQNKSSKSAATNANTHLKSLIGKAYRFRALSEQQVLYNVYINTLKINIYILFL